MRLSTLALFFLILVGFALRLRYLLTTHPFFDEYTTVLAARQVLQNGWPVLPSGLFYEHGLLATYLIAPFAALFIHLPLDTWQPAHWGLMLARWPSVLLSTATIPLIYVVGRHSFGTPSTKGTLAPYISLLAAGLFVISPEGMVWGGRARMYALATLLVLLTVYWSYRGTLYPGPAKYRWGAMLALLTALLTQLGALILVPPLLIAMGVVGWLSWRHQPESSSGRPWFFRPSILLEGLALVAIVGFALYVKRLGQPLGVPALEGTGRGPLWRELLDTATYQTAIHFTWPDTVKFLSRQFGIPHHFWLTLIAVAGAIIGLIVGLGSRAKPNKSSYIFLQNSHFPLFLWLVFGLIVLEMVTLLEPFRRNPRYLVMVLPLFYLLAAHAIFSFRFLFPAKPGTFRQNRRPKTPTWIVIVLIAFFAAIGFEDLRLALVTPEPAYEQALAFVRAEWQPGDRLLTMNTPAAELFMNQVDGFTVQEDADQFLLNRDTGPVDRWLGSPWVGTATDFSDALNKGSRTWFVIDAIRQPVYFRGDWLAVVYHQMELLWQGDNALVYRTRSHRRPLAMQPDTTRKATLDDSVQLCGFTFDSSQEGALSLTLFWQPLQDLTADHSIFLHLRNQAGVTVAQHDGQPLDGVYPTSHWQLGELVIDPITLPLPEDLPAGKYTLLGGMYQLDTLERLPVANDVSGENAVILGEVNLP